MFLLFLVAVQVGPVFPSKSTMLYTWLWVNLLSQCTDNQNVWAGIGHETYRHSSESWSPFRVLDLMRKGLIGSFGPKLASSAESTTYCIKSFFISCGDCNSHLILPYLHVIGLIFHSSVEFFWPYKCTVKSSVLPCWRYFMWWGSNLHLGQRDSGILRIRTGRG